MWQSRHLTRSIPGGMIPPNMGSTAPPVFFNKEQAANYDGRFRKLAPMQDALHLLTSAVLAELPEEARILCVGAGTGAEIMALAERFPGWHFTAVEPAGAMLDVFRGKAAEAGIAERCSFHEGYLESLPETEPFHAATSFLVSQFLLTAQARRGFFEGISNRLLPGGCLVSTDLSSDRASGDYQELFSAWVRLQAATGIPLENLEKLREVYGRDVAVSTPHYVEAIISSAGFGKPVQFYQSLLIRGWFARRAS